MSQPRETTNATAPSARAALAELPYLTVPAAAAGMFVVEPRPEKSRTRMINLLNETIDAIRQSGHSISDIDHIGSRDAAYSCAWDEYRELANREYDNSYGAVEVAIDLVVLFGDGSWLEREEYDGAEGWTYRTQPSRWSGGGKIRSLFIADGNCCRDTVAEIAEAMEGLP